MKHMMKHATPYVFVGPALLILAALMLYPISRVVQYSFYDNHIVTPNPVFIGLKNFSVLAGDPVFWRSLVNSVVFTAVSVAGHLLVGMFLAILLNQEIHPVARTFFRSVLILPWIFTAVVVALNWQLLLQPLGVVNYFLQSLGLLSDNIDWLGDKRTAMLALIGVNFWRGYPFFMISILAGLQGIPKSLYEAGSVDGANVWQNFRHITLPGLAPVLFSISLLDTIWTFRLFPLPWLLTGGGPGRATEVLATFTYRFAFVNFQFGKASALAVILLIFTMFFTWFYLKFQRRAD